MDPAPRNPQRAKSTKKTTPLTTCWKADRSEANIHLAVYKVALPEDRFFELRVQTDTLANAIDTSKTISRDLGP
ncbi:hypothetical protein N7495_003374 [Penicillium taxi]|uniref:uncharacterized protein n=1 Tax=Penicillium taxi TaxID=168475 RepID=UPI002545B9E5|nr:uncharacterized protein N7495_003374 [Penicillium taxi]KAJ5902846.1 hypothetical protein N7495_003374 [Penicillium taxi]